METRTEERPVAYGMEARLRAEVGVELADPYQPSRTEAMRSLGQIFKELEDGAA